MNVDALPLFEPLFRRLIARRSKPPTFEAIKKRERLCEAFAFMNFTSQPTSADRDESRVMRGAADQLLEKEYISPPFAEETERRTLSEVVSETKRTEPSTMETLQPPG